MKCAACGKQLTADLVGIYYKIRSTGGYARLILHQADIPIRIRGNSPGALRINRGASPLILIPANPGHLEIPSNRWHQVSGVQFQMAEESSEEIQYVRLNIFTRLFKKRSLGEQLAAEICENIADTGPEVKHPVGVGSQAAFVLTGS